MKNSLLLFLFFITKLYFISLIFSLFACSSSKTTKKNKRKKSSKGKKSNDKKVDEIKQTSFSTAHQGKTEIILNAQPQDIEKYINDKEGGDEIIEQVVKALEKKKQEKSDMRKYKHWLDFIEQKQ